MSKKKIALAMLIGCAAVSIALALVYNNYNVNDERDTIDSITLNFYKEEYEQEYSSYEKFFPSDKNQKNELYLSGNTDSGEIKVQIFDPDGILTDDLVIGDTLKTSINMNAKYGEWKAIVEIFPDTAGSITFSY